MCVAPRISSTVSSPFSLQSGSIESDGTSRKRSQKLSVYAAGEYGHQSPGPSKGGLEPALNKQLRVNSGRVTERTD